MYQFLYVVAMMVIITNLLAIIFSVIIFIIATHLLEFAMFLDQP